MALQVQHGGVLALLEQAEPPRNLLIRLRLAAQVAAEAILVELLVGLHVP